MKNMSYLNMFLKYGGIMLAVIGLLDIISSTGECAYTGCLTGIFMFSVGYLRHENQLLREEIVILKSNDRRIRE